MFFKETIINNIVDNIVNSFTIGSFQIAKGAVLQAPVHVSDERVACERVLGGLDSPTYFEFRADMLQIK